MHKKHFSLQNLGEKIIKLGFRMRCLSVINDEKLKKVLEFCLHDILNK